MDVELLAYFLLNVALILGWLFYIRTYLGTEKFLDYFKDSFVLYGMLLGWILFGFINTLDYSLDQGCIISHQNVFSIENITFSSIALILISIAYYFRNSMIGLIILLAELVFWITKLLLWKHGYHVGYAGYPDSIVLYYDTLALLLRLLLIRQLYFKKYTVLSLLVTTFITMIIKIEFF